MPQEPKKRHSRQRKGKRRASIKFSVPKVVSCPNCGNAVRPHLVCPNCGFYNGRQVLTINKKPEEKEKKS